MSDATTLLERDPHCLCGGCTAKQQRPCADRPRGLPAACYRIYGRSGRLLYVGCSENVEYRADHQCRTVWWVACEPIGRTVIEHYMTRQEALTVEARAILTEAPVVNVKIERPPLHAGWSVVPYGIDVWWSESGRDLGDRLIAIGRDPEDVYEAYLLEKRAAS